MKWLIGVRGWPCEGRSVWPGTGHLSHLLATQGASDGRWAPDTATFLEYGRLLALLRRAGLRVYDVSTGWCSNGEQMGIVPFAAESGYFRRRGGHCENILFARSAHRVPGAVERWPMFD